MLHAKSPYCSLWACPGGFLQALYQKNSILSLGLKGYVRNMDDGNVEVVAEGPEDKINELIEFCKKGPEAAKVEKVDAELEKAKGEFYSFDVRH